MALLIFHFQCDYKQVRSNKDASKGRDKKLLKKKIKILFSMVQWYFIFKGYLQSGIHASAFSIIL